MKTTLTLLLLLFATASFAQTIRRVNADATVTGTNVYTTLQAAHDAAAAGDILIVEPGNSVGNLTCSKTLTIYGRGYFLESNPNYVAMPNRTFSSTVGDIVIAANNVKISGLAGNYFYISGASGVTISRSNLNYLNIGGSASAPCNNLTISQNYFYNGMSITGVATGLVSNVSFFNNNIRASQGYFISNNTFISAITFSQNVIEGSSLAAGGAVAYNTVFINNVFTSTQTIPFSTNNTSYFYNVFPTGSTIDSGMGSNHTFVSSLGSQFASNTGGPDNNYRVISGSVLKTAGSTGGEVGMFGGATPYVPYGIPAAPAVLKVRSDGVGNSTTPITLTISATSNN